jgi:hypothetical protein
LGGRERSRRVGSGRGRWGERWGASSEGHACLAKLAQVTKLILDNHFAHISKETKAWLANQPAGRFEFIFTQSNGSSRNLVEGFLSELTRSVLRHIRVASNQKLKDRVMAAMDEFNCRSTGTTRSHDLIRIWKSMH